MTAIRKKKDKQLKADKYATLQLKKEQQVSKSTSAISEVDIANKPKAVMTAENPIVVEVDLLKEYPVNPKKKVS